MRSSILIILILVAGCTHSNFTPDAVEVDFHFNHLIDGSEVILDQLMYKNALDQEFSIKTIKYFISHIQFHLTDGNTIDFDDIFYIDIRSPETLTHTLSRKIPTGDYKGISFVYGLVADDNITGKFASPPESLMEWPQLIGGGYHYMKLEGEYLTNGTTSFFNIHTGMLAGNAYEIYIDKSKQPFSVTSNKLDIDISMDIQNWFTSPYNWNFEYFGGGIMGNQEAQQTVHKNGHDVFTINISTTP